MRIVNDYFIWIVLLHIICDKIVQSEMLRYWSCLNVHLEINNNSFYFFLSRLKKSPAGAGMSSTQSTQHYLIQKFYDEKMLKQILMFKITIHTFLNGNCLADSNFSKFICTHISVCTFISWLQFISRSKRTFDFSWSLALASLCPAAASTIVFFHWNYLNITRLELNF